MNRKQRAAWLLLAVAITVLDLWSKGLWRYPARIQDPPVLERVLVEDWLYIRTIWNEGGVWSLPLGSAVLLWATILAVPVLLAWIFWRPAVRTWPTVAKVLVLGGAVGNLYDRLRFEAVRDFIDVCFGDAKGWHWPTFNVADMALLVGIGLLLLLSLLERPRPRRETA